MYVWVCLLGFLHYYKRERVYAQLTTINRYATHAQLRYMAELNKFFHKCVCYFKGLKNNLGDYRSRELTVNCRNLSASSFNRKIFTSYPTFFRYRKTYINPKIRVLPVYSVLVFVLSAHLHSYYSRYLSSPISVRFVHFSLIFSTSFIHTKLLELYTVSHTLPSHQHTLKEGENFSLINLKTLHFFFTFHTLFLD